MTSFGIHKLAPKVKTKPNKSSFSMQIQTLECQMWGIRLFRACVSTACLGSLDMNIALCMMRMLAAKGNPCLLARA